MPTCPVCAYPKLAEPPRSPSGGGSYEICPSCGFQFGVDDDDKGITHAEWRTRWTEKGTPWSNRGIAKPEGWNAKSQLATLKKPATKAPAKAAKPAKKSARKKR